MLLLWQPGQQKHSQEFAVSRGLENGPLYVPSTRYCSSEFRPSGHGKLHNLRGVRQLRLILETENTFCRCIYGCFCWLSHILLRQNRTTKPTQQGELREKICSCRAPTRAKLSHFSLRRGANTEPLGASA